MVTQLAINNNNYNNKNVKNLPHNFLIIYELESKENKGIHLLQGNMCFCPLAQCGHSKRGGLCFLIAQVVVGADLAGASPATRTELLKFKRMQRRQLYTYAYVYVTRVWL